jgi:hypothetical protein
MQTTTFPHHRCRRLPIGVYLVRFGFVAPLEALSEVTRVARPKRLRGRYQADGGRDKAFSCTVSRHLIGRNDDSKRLEAFDVFSNLYDLRSNAVHTGKLPPKLKRPMPGHTVASLLKVGFGFGAAAIREAIKLGMPDLDAIVLAPRPIAIVPKQPKKK